MRELCKNKGVGDWGLGFRESDGETERLRDGEM